MTKHPAPTAAGPGAPDLLVQLLPYFVEMLGALAIMVVTMAVTVRMPAGPRRSLVEGLGITASVMSAVAIAALSLPVILNG